MERTPIELKHRCLVVAATMALAVLLGPLEWPPELHPPLTEGESVGRQLWSFAARVGFFLRDVAPSVLAVFLAHGLVHGRPIATLGFRAPLARHLFIGLGLGMLMRGADTLLELAVAGSWEIEWNIPSGAPCTAVVVLYCAWALLAVVPSALLEELVFRSYPIEQFREEPRLMVWVVVVASLVFSAIHHIWDPVSVGAFVSRFLSGLIWSYLYIHWRSIWLVAGVHAGSNLMLDTLFGDWETGGLWRLTYSDPSEGIRLAIRLVVTAGALLLIDRYRRRTQRLPGVERPSGGG
jgi:membrane protease YdiL (CAAX protease family)